MDRMQGSWANMSNLSPRGFTCGHCNHYMSADDGYIFNNARGQQTPTQIYVCAHCNRPNYFEHQGDGRTIQSPGSAFGSPVDGVPSSVDSLYEESRNCMKVSAYTSAVLACRKLLMNIAVEEGAKDGKPFITYVEYLADKGYVPPGGKGWVDHIRKQGNEATHEIDMKTEDEAKDLISFAEMLLKFIYEFPGRVPEPQAESAST